jgi:hypothetical protein
LLEVRLESLKGLERIKIQEAPEILVSPIETIVKIGEKCTLKKNTSFFDQINNDGFL